MDQKTADRMKAVLDFMMFVVILMVMVGIAIALIRIAERNEQIEKERMAPKVEIPKKEYEVGERHICGGCCTFIEGPQEYCAKCQTRGE